jgi:Flp pilus assembly protein TadG
MIRFMRLAKDDRGASIIELALVAPVLASLLIGMVDLSRAYSYKLKLEQAAQRAIEKVQAYQTTTSTYGTLQSEAAAAAGVPTGNVTIDYWLECDGVRAANYDSVCAAGQTYARWVTVTVQGTFTPMFRSKYYPRANANGTFTILGKTGMRTQ